MGCQIRRLAHNHLFGTHTPSAAVHDQDARAVGVSWSINICQEVSATTICHDDIVVYLRHPLFPLF